MLCRELGRTAESIEYDSLPVVLLGCDLGEVVHHLLPRRCLLEAIDRQPLGTVLGSDDDRVGEVCPEVRLPDFRRPKDYNPRRPDLPP